jgi:peptide/nickel transport system permease protein
MGSLIGEAVLKRQYVALQSAVALIAIGFVLLNFFIDYLYSVLDPRIRERAS